MFKSARIKLTAWFILGVMVISLAFSLLIYKTQTDEIERFAGLQRLRIERRLREGNLLPPNFIPGPPIIDEEIIAATRLRIVIFLIFINLAVLVGSGGVGYFLAGKTLRPIKEMLEEQNRFISDASHELRTPITSLKSAMEVFLRGKKQTVTEARDLLTQSVTQVNKLQALAEGLLHLAQFQKQNGNLHIELVKLDEVIWEGVRRLATSAKEKSLVIDSRITKTQIEGNRESLVDLVVILLDNAIKYSHPNGRIKIAADRDDKKIKLSVIDFGIGIEKKDLPYVFDRFFRADTAREKAGTGGYGLGLAIAKGIVERHQGKIMVESEAKKGTSFVVWLPRKQARRIGS